MLLYIELVYCHKFVTVHACYYVNLLFNLWRK